MQYVRTYDREKMYYIMLFKNLIGKCGRSLQNTKLYPKLKIYCNITCASIPNYNLD